MRYIIYLRVHFTEPFALCYLLYDVCVLSMTQSVKGISLVVLLFFFISAACYYLPALSPSN